MSETSDEIDPREVAHHEAAHTVFHLKLGMRQGRVTIRPDASRGTLGQAQLRRPKWINHPPTPAREEQRLRIQAENEILALYAGRIAQAKYAGRGIDWGHEGARAAAICSVADSCNLIWSPIEIHARMPSFR